MKITDKIFKFFGGIKPDGHKQISTRNPIKKIKIPENLIIPIRQHVGKIPNIVVKVGDKVLKGQVIAEPVANISAATHASTSGTVTSIKKANIPHPSGLPDLCITIKSDGKDLWIPSKKLDTSVSMSAATAFVLTIGSITSWIVNQYFLIPYNLEYLRTISFIVIIAAVVQFTEMVMEKN
jgi:electron transport complex protein RnfC